MDLQLMQSSSEINTISKRAARAVGYSWGVAEEVGKCISSIEMFGISGVENLNNYFKTIKGIEPEGPKQIEKTNKLNDKSLCPIYTGLKLIDNYKSVDGIKVLKFINLDYPLLLLPFVNKLSYLIGKRIEISIDDINAECNLNTCVLADHQIKSLIIKKANTVKINILENEDSFSSKTWNELYEMSTETFVEETEQSKQTGAGAGLRDND